MAAESDATLQEIASLLTLRPELSLFVDGHTDSEGADDYNMNLSEGRAQAVVDALVEKFDVAPGRLEARGLGESQPVADNGSEQGRAWNRRVELVAKE